jgi:F0F1-type ATP synthase assembly protein I
VAKKTENNSWALASGLGFEIIIPIIIGGIIGKSIDSKFGTHPKFMLSLLFFGAFLGFYNLYRIVKSLEH